MNKLSLLLFTVIAPSAMASTNLAHFKYRLDDISEKSLNPQTLFIKMQRSKMDLENSICANRAHVWAYDFYRLDNLNVGKIFVFFTANIWREDKKGWMYHVAPYIIHQGSPLVMEATYSDVVTPLSIDEWVFNETYGRVRGNDCLEITEKDTDLTEYFYERRPLPEKRNNGKPGAKCYIRKTPGYFTYPTSIAMYDLKKDQRGRDTEYDPRGYDLDEVFDACKDAFSGKRSPLFSGAIGKCKEYLNIKR